MMPTSNSCSICLFCYKPASSAHSTGNFGEDEGYEKPVEASVLINRFIALLDRYINNVQKPSTSHFEWSKHLSCCQECLVLVREFCADYHQLKLLELQLEWKLERLAAGMELAGRVPTRWARLQKLFEAQASYMTKDACQSSLSAIRRFRQNIFRKCSHRHSKTPPRVLLNRKDQDLGSQLNKSKPKIVATQLIVVKVETPEVEQGCRKEDNCRENGSPVDVKSETDDNVSSIDSYGINDTGINSDNNAQDDRPEPSETNETSGADGDDTKETTNSSKDSGSNDNIFGCPKCKKHFATPVRVTRHLRKVHTTGRHECPESECNKVFKSQQLLKAHILTHTGHTRSRYKCLDCYKSFERRSTLLQHHGRAHNKGTPIICEICGGLYFSQQYLDKHMHAKHTHKCKQCGKVFNTTSALNEHLVGVHSSNRL